MPTPRAHGGAGLIKFPLTSPGFLGLNTEMANSLLGVEWATVLTNTVIDGAGRLAARKGWETQTNTPHTSRFNQLIEYRTASGTTELIATTSDAVAGEVMKSTDDGDTWSDVTGTAAFTSGNWQLMNYNDFVIGFQDGEAPLVYNGTTSSQIADVNAPDGGTGLAAFGRLWGVHTDGVTLAYSALLDHTDFTTADSGIFDLSSVWPDTDTIQGLAEYNGALVIFGARNIIIYIDGAGSALGIDPINMYVADLIPGLGLGSRDTIQNIKGDMWFMGNDQNIYSLNRVIQERSAPLANVSKNVSNAIKETIETFANYDLTTIRSVYSPSDRFYLLFLPRESAPGSLLLEDGTNDEIGTTWCFDTRQALDDGSYRCMGRWTDNVARAATTRADGDVLWALQEEAGEVGRYEGYSDNQSNSYTFDYESGWTDIQDKQGYTLILKRLRGVWRIKSDTTVTMKWGFDFSDILLTQFLQLFAEGQGGMFGISEWGSNGSWDPNDPNLVAGTDVSEYAGSISLQEKQVGGRGAGEYLKLGCALTVDGTEVSMQNMDLFAKVGRLR